MKLYYSKGACSLAVRITIHEIGLKVKYESVNLKTKQTETGADYLSINPKGAVPCLLIEENEVLTENATIQIYLAEKSEAFELLPQPNEFKRYRVLEWLSFTSSDLHKTCGALFNADIPQELKDKIYIPALKKKLDFVANSLGKKKYLLGDTFTIADSYMFIILFWLKKFEIDINTWPNLARYFGDLTKRKSIEQSLTEEDIKL